MKPAVLVSTICAPLSGRFTATMLSEMTSGERMCTLFKTCKRFPTYEQGLWKVCELKLVFMNVNRKYVNRRNKGMRTSTESTRWQLEMYINRATILKTPQT